jgi:hypothetical protein
MLNKMYNNVTLKDYYKRYCKILSRTIQLAKKMHYSKLISCSSNKSNAAWTVIKLLTNKQSNSKEELMLNLEGKLIKDPQILADTFSRYFSIVVEKSVNIATKLDHNQINKKASMEYLMSNFSQPFLPINPKPITVKEIKSLKWKNSCRYDQIPNRIVKLSMTLFLLPCVIYVIRC